MGEPALAGLLLFAAASAALAVEDPLQTWAGLDADRHVWMSSDRCREEPLTTVVPGFFAPAGSCALSSPLPDTGLLSTALATRYRNLIHRNGLPGVAYDALASVFEMRLRLHRALELRSVWEAGRAHQSFQDSYLAFAAEPSAPSWEVHNSLAWTWIPTFTPVLGAGAGTDGSRELALGGRFQNARITFSLAGGWKSRDLPLALDLPDYRPLTLPLLLRQTFQVAALEGRLTHVDLYAKSKFTQDRHPETFGEPYSLSDSGRGAEYFAGAAWTDTGSALRYRFSLEGERYEGRRVFRGTRADDEGLYQFAYEETRQRNAWARVDAQAGAGRHPGAEGGVFAGWGAVRWDALRPEIASGHYFWDRNGVLDSYEGSLLDLFSQQTYLFDGQAGLSQKTAGAWYSFPAYGNRLRLGLSWHRIEMEAYGRLTQKTTTLIIAYTEREYLLHFYGVEADLLAPEIQFSRRFGRAFVEASVEQALPLRIRMRHSGGAEPGPRSSSSSYSGGTEAWVRLGWGFL